MYFCILKEALYYSEDYCNGIDLETTLWFMLFRTSCFDKQQTRTHSCCNSHSRYYSHLYQNFDRNFLLKFIMSLVFSLQTIVLLTYSWHSFSQYHSHLYSLHIINYMFFCQYMSIIILPYFEWYMTWWHLCDHPCISSPYPKL